MIPPGVRLFTWVDVEEVLLRAHESHNWPNGLLRASAYWSGLNLRFAPTARRDIEKWLADLFLPRFDKERGSILLESLAKQNRYFPIEWEEAEPDEAQEPLRFEPLLGRPRFLTSESVPQAQPLPLNEKHPPIIAVHSFKGGVGKTLHALALARAIIQRSKGNKTTVLLIDGDLEAPGLTWLLESRQPDPPVAYTDLLTLVHSDPEIGAMGSLELVKAKLEDSRFDGIYVLPAFRSSRRFSELEIRPEHLIRGSQDPFILTYVLAELGNLLGVDAVIIDLRAGLSELSSGLFLDPRVHRLLVTNLSGQSLEGIIQVLELMAQRAPVTAPNHPMPTLLFTFATPEMKKIGFLEAQLKRLQDKVNRLFSKTEDSVNLHECTVLVSSFFEQLLSLSLKWDEVLELIDKLGISELMKPLTLTLRSKKLTITIESDTLKERLTQLKNFLLKLESHSTNTFYPLPNLTRLVEDHRSRLPITWISGLEGSGKTQIYLQMLRAGRWPVFARRVTQGVDVLNDAFFIPLIAPKDRFGLVSELDKQAQSKLKETFSSVQMFNAWSFDQITDRFIKKVNGIGLSSYTWMRFWLNAIAWRCGYKPGKSGAGLDFLKYLEQQETSVICLIDGLDSLFTDKPEDAPKAMGTAAKALLLDLFDFLEQQPVSGIGLIAFIDDFWQVAITRNSGWRATEAHEFVRQTIYDMKWSFLEQRLNFLVWILSQAKVLPIESHQSYNNLSNVTEIFEYLEPFWGNEFNNRLTKYLKFYPKENVIGFPKFFIEKIRLAVDRSLQNLRPRSTLLSRESIIKLL